MISAYFDKQEILNWPMHQHSQRYHHQYRYQPVCVFFYIIVSSTHTHTVLSMQEITNPVIISTSWSITLTIGYKVFECAIWNSFLFSIRYVHVGEAFAESMPTSAAIVFTWRNFHFFNIFENSFDFLCRFLNYTNILSMTKNL